MNNCKGCAREHCCSMSMDGDCPAYMIKIDNPFRYEPNRRERRAIERRKKKEMKQSKRH